MARILLAEDDEAMRQFLAAALSRAGHEVASHADGRSALGAFAPGQSEPYDLLIADIVMPGLRVMFITGFAAVALAGRPEPVPGAAVLSKPFHLRELVSWVDRLLAA